ncbi:MAG: hypothetical protein PHF37_02970 [Phycisphaerae bacterium]|nr:hypothetical protein [Phycisphaerae bacterium]
MSTLTKVLIILVTAGVLFLCGTVVTYVANAENYKETAQQTKKQLDSERSKAANAQKQLEEKTANFDNKVAGLQSQISTLQTQLSAAQGDLKDAQRLIADKEDKISAMASSVETTSLTAQKQTELFEAKQSQLKEIEALSTKLQKELNETTAALVEKMAVVDQLQAEKRGLEEQKVAMQNKLDQMLSPTDRTAFEPLPVTLPIDKAAPVPPIGYQINLKGKIVAVDVNNNLASISLGLADGVKEGMRFHIVRENQFIADLVVTESDSNESVGKLDLVQQTPKPGDLASTNL